MSGTKLRYRLLDGIGKSLITLGILTLLFAAFQLWGTGFEESAGQDELAASFTKSAGTDSKDDSQADIANVVKKFSEVDPETAPPMAPPPEGEPAGVIRIPKIGVERVIVAGTAKADLKKGPGHYSGTPLPGQKGNAGIAGHRTTYGAPFNRIDELAPGDEIEVITPQGAFTYEVIAPELNEPHVEHGPGWRSVRPEQSDVLRDFGDNRITLTACHPKFSAAQRIIVTGKLKAKPAAAAPVERPATNTTDTNEDDTGAEVAAGTDLEGDLGWNREHIPLTLTFAGLAFVAWLVAYFVGRAIDRKWLIYLLMSPIYLTLIWFCYVNLDRTLPSF